MIVSSPGSPSSEESVSPEPINKLARNGITFDNVNKVTTTSVTIPVTIPTSTTTTPITCEQITPTSSVDTEEGNIRQLEEGEKGVEGDVEASDDDLVSKRIKS